MRYWMYGMHAVREALANPRRPCHRLYYTAKVQGQIAALARQRGVPAELADTGHFARVLPAGSVHQGVALQVDPLAPPSLESLGSLESAVVLILDQVTDPHNVGAILRSAAAFGAAAVMAQSRHAPEESGTLAKTASGALEHVPYLVLVHRPCLGSGNGLAGVETFPAHGPGAGRGRGGLAAPGRPPLRRAGPPANRAAVPQPQCFQRSRRGAV
jgi:tRNA G18 (ribose-2'-O)-methylase SpoU